jgi:hypothetical protein
MSYLCAQTTLLSKNPKCRFASSASRFVNAKCTLAGVENRFANTLYWSAVTNFLSAKTKRRFAKLFCKVAEANFNGAAATFLSVKPDHPIFTPNSQTPKLPG